MSDPVPMPQKVGDYTIRGLLGQGAVATVYEGEHSLIGRRAAIKVLKSGIGHTFSDEDFVDEARKLARLESPNIVRMYEFGFYERAPYFAMEIVDGGDLQGLIECGKWPDETVTALLLLQVLEGLRTAHLQNIIHRDLSTRNILIQKKGVAKITDFGISADARQTVDRHTNKGTIQFLSPEHLASSSPSPAADLFSLGTITYYLLTRRFPFQGASRDEIFQAIVERRYIDPKALRADLAPDLANFIHACYGEWGGTPSHEQLAGGLHKYLAKTGIAESEGPARLATLFFSHTGEQELSEQIEAALAKNRPRVALNILNNALTLFPDSAPLAALIPRIQAARVSDEEEEAQTPGGTVGFTQAVIEGPLPPPVSGKERDFLGRLPGLVVIASILIFGIVMLVRNYLPGSTPGEVSTPDSNPAITQEQNLSSSRENTPPLQGGGSNPPAQAIGPQGDSLTPVTSPTPSSPQKKKPPFQGGDPKSPTQANGPRGDSLPSIAPIGPDSAALRIILPNARVNLNNRFVGITGEEGRVFRVAAQVWNVTAETPDGSYRRAISCRNGLVYTWDPLKDLLTAAPPAAQDAKAAP